jgi:multidrug efflux pump subunit AcrB
MVGITRELFIPLSLAVGFAMIASTVLASTLVPIMSVWLLKEQHHAPKRDFLDVLKDGLNRLVEMLLPLRVVVVVLYLVVSCVVVFILYQTIGKELFPATASSQFRVRVSAPTGMRVEALERRVLTTL